MKYFTIFLYLHNFSLYFQVNAKPPAYYMGAGPPTTLPRGGSLIRAYSPAGGPPIPADRIKSLPGGAGELPSQNNPTSFDRYLKKELDFE